MKRLILTVLCLSAIWANPMLSEPVNTKVIPQQKLIDVSVFSPVINKISIAQRNLRKEITLKTRELKQEANLKYLFIILGAVFLYGFVHALGPGHGKVIAASYFVGTKANVLKGVLFGFVFSIIHSLSAVVLFVGMMLFAKVMPMMGASSYEKYMQKISFYLIACIGAYIIYKGLKNIRQKHQKENHLQHATVPVALGLVPCPGTLLFLTFFTSINMLWLGVLSVFLIALGMAFALSIISVLVILFREKSLAVLDGKRTIQLGNYLTILGGVLLVTLGLLLAMG